VKTYPVYLASPWFNQAQEERHNLVLQLLRTHTENVRAPREIFECPPDADALTRRTTFRRNLEEIRAAKFVVAITDEKDPGTLVEWGYAMAHGTPIVGIALTLGKHPFNLMLAESAHCVAKSIPELEEILTYFDVHDKLPAREWEGTIE